LRDRIPIISSRLTPIRKSKHFLYSRSCGYGRKGKLAAEFYLFLMICTLLRIQRK
jgi:hypothetical protein